MVAFAFAGRYEASPIGLDGAFRPATSFEVRLRGTATKADLYTSRTKALVGANPLGSDARGRLTFFADPGDLYDLWDGSAAWPISVPVDPQEALPGTLLNSAARETQFTTTNVTYGNAAEGAGGGKISGLSCPFIGTGRRVELCYRAGSLFHSVANTLIGVYLLVDGAAAGGEHEFTQTTRTDGGPGVYVKNPRFLTVEGAAYTLEAGAYGVAAGTVSIPAAANLGMQLWAKAG